MDHEAYRLDDPAVLRSGAVFASPHSGRDYPAAFLAASRLDARAIRSSEDAFVDLLLAAAPAAGAPLLSARYPRAYLDLNRAPEELDPAVIEGAPVAPGNPRITSGLGVIPRVVSNGRAIYRTRIPLAEACARIEAIHGPYHACLGRLMARAADRFGQAVLFDLHSMPHDALDSLGHGRIARPEIILGDRFGSSADPALTARVEAVFRDAGFRVARNAPFAGAYVAQAHGRPALGRHVVQIEIDRALYMNEVTIRPHAGFDRLRAVFETILPQLAALATPLGGAALAAE
ncbi:MAG: N-formylglutamate amidohydrolase [Rhodobacteraceae bacterium]|nr:N-formylglutamate amidohydrolase [Paracoccaceae bacterium]